MFIADLFAFFFMSSPQVDSFPVIPWHEAQIFQIPTQSDSQVETIVNQYLDNLASQGLIKDQQGVWIQSDWAIDSDHRGKIPAPAASLTKVATSIASLQKWGLDHRFTTSIYTSGKINNGVLEGDLIVEAGGDPFFVWEEAIALSSKLEKLGIQTITGNLIIVGNWQMNYEENPQKSGELLKQALNAKNWSYSVEKQYQDIKDSFFRPQITIQGAVKVVKNKPDKAELLLTHQSLTLREILRLMNVYSNNKIAESLAQQLGGGQKIAQITAQVINIPQEEILLQNGSGLGVDNRISPRAAARMFMALNGFLENTNYNLGDLFPVSGIDPKGTIEARNMPIGIPCKTGTLAVVSALAGVIPTSEREKVYFAIINYGNDLDNLRNQQDLLLHNLENHWTLNPIKPNSTIEIQFGDRP